MHIDLIFYLASLSLRGSLLNAYYYKFKKVYCLRYLIRPCIFYIMLLIKCLFFGIYYISNHVIVIKYKTFIYITF